MAAAGAALAVVGVPRPARATATTLTVQRRTIEVNGRAALVYGILRPDGGHGVVLGPGERFAAELVNRIDGPTLVHWHGQAPPNAQDGVPGVTQPALKPGGSYHYDFDPRPGTHWMHSHFGLQEQQLMAAPMVVRTAEDLRADMQEAVLLLHDFTFRDPEEILTELKSGGRRHKMAGPPPARAIGQSAHQMPGMDAQSEGGHGSRGSREPGQKTGGGGPGMTMDLNDVEFDAFLANDRTLDDPEIVRVEPGGRVRLRIINAATSTHFFIDVGGLEAEIVATDGMPVVPLAVRRVPIAMAQRIDLVIRVPAAGGAWPVLAQREGTRERTGLVLATKSGHVQKIPGQAAGAAGALGMGIEASLRAARPPAPKPADLSRELELTGDMASYRWGIDGKVWGEHEPIRPKPGDRVHLTFKNRTMMSHPMHLHGHHFQVVAIQGRPLSGAMRDTVLVPADGGTVTIAFDADNPGRWVMHCHNLYHMAAGMMTEVRYGV